ncbi:winged helix-turn-helix domain-containing protein [Lachnospiraceae bacterium ZAX-1]
MPEYTIKREDIMVMFKSLVNNTDQATDQSTNRVIRENGNLVVARILKVICDEPTLSQQKIADRIGEEASTVKYYMDFMKESGIIKRAGNSQKGKWIIL